MADGYPSGAAERIGLRRHHRDRILGQAADQAARFGLSLKCRGHEMAVQHADSPGGCANSGATCLCECHDRAEVDGG